MKNKDTCAEYREEIMLLGLRRRLSDNNISEEERQSIKREIKKLEARMEIS